MISEAAQNFVRLAGEMSGRGTEWAPLQNVTFWAGAGFSRAWEPRSPGRTELFTIRLDALSDVMTPAVLRRLFGVELTGDLGPATLRQIVYFLDMNEKHPEVRGRYYDDRNVVLLRSALRAMVQQNFEQHCDLNFVHRGKSQFPTTTLSAQQRAIVAFFALLEREAEQSSGLAQGLRYHFLTTNYDFVIENILEQVLAPSGSFFPNAYRGFTPSRVVGRPPSKPVPEHWVARNLLKLNGGFEIVQDRENYELDYHRRDLATLLAAPPIIMLPSREQDYSDAYFRSLFPKAVRLMRESRVIVLVGYSMSEDDALIRFILRQFAEDVEDAFGKHVFYVDTSDEARQQHALREIFPYAIDYGVPTFHFYSGSFATFAAECLEAMGDRQSDIEASAGS